MHSLEADAYVGALIGVMTSGAAHGDNLNLDIEWVEPDFVDAMLTYVSLADDRGFAAVTRLGPPVAGPQTWTFPEPPRWIEDGLLDGVASADEALRWSRAQGGTVTQLDVLAGDALPPRRVTSFWVGAAVEAVTLPVLADGRDVFAHADEDAVRVRLVTCTFDEVTTRGGGCGEVAISRDLTVTRTP